MDQIAKLLSLNQKSILEQGEAGENDIKYVILISSSYLSSGVLWIEIAHMIWTASLSVLMVQGFLKLA